MDLKEKIANAETRGSAIIGFDYDGKRRNVQINTRKVGDLANMGWGERYSKSVVDHNGESYVVGIDQTDKYQIKTFNLEKVYNLTGV